MRAAARVSSVAATLLCIAATLAHANGEGDARYEIKVEQLQAQPTMTMQFKAAPEDLGASFGRAFGAVYAYVMSQGGEVVGPAFGRYHSMDAEEFEVEAGLPVAQTLAERGAVKPSELPAGTVLTTVHVGPYEGLGAAHDALQEWARQHGKKVTGGPWESYLTDPGQASDPNDYETKLYLPIEADESSEPN